MKNQKRILSLVMSLMIVIGALLTPTTSEAVNWENKVINSSYQYNAVEVDLKEIGIDGAKVIGLSLLSNGKRINSHLNINKDSKVEVLTELKPGTEYDLRVITEDKNYTLKVKVDGLPKIEIRDESYIIRVPAMPEKGFNFPYLLRVPTKQSVNRPENKRDKNYLITETMNYYGGTKDYIESIATVEVENRSIYGSNYAETLGLPMILPVIPRTHALYLYEYNNENYYGALYEHALDRDSMTLKKLIESPNGKMLKESLSKYKIEPESLYNLDKQVLAMINHAIGYLNSSDYKVEDKIIMTGFSGSAVFAKRFTSLYPERIKVLIAGGSMEEVVVPAETYKDKRLMYPLGVADHEDFTGKKFDKTAYANVAKMIYQGTADTSDGLYGHDSFGEEERQLVMSLYGTDFKKRIEGIKKAYKENGGTGMFIFMKGVAHENGPDMWIYIPEFIRDNINSDTPVYNQPKNSEINKNNLMIEIYK